METLQILLGKKICKFMIQGGDFTNFIGKENNPLFEDFRSKVVQQVEDAISFTKTGDLIERMLLKETGAKLLTQQESIRAPSDHAKESIVMPRLSTNHMNASVEEGVEKTLGNLGFIILKYEDKKWFSLEDVVSRYSCSVVGFYIALSTPEGVNIINAFKCSKIRLLKVLNNQLTLDIEDCQISFQ